MISGKARRVRRGFFCPALGVSLLMVLAGTLLNVAVPMWFKAHDQTILTITSGSMSPLIEAGDMVVLQAVGPETDLQPGDIVTYSGSQPGSTTGLISHRIIQKTTLPEQDGVWLQTQGDANRSPDPNLTPESAVVGTVVQQLGPFGRIMQQAQEPVWRLVAFAPALVLLGLAELPMLFGRSPEDAPTTASVLGEPRSAG